MSFIPISAEEEYKKNSDIKKEDIVELSKWMNTQPHLPKLSELQLICYYHSSHGCMDMTKKTIEINYTGRAHWDAVFKDLDPLSPQNVHTLESCLITLLPGVTKEGYKVLFLRLMNFKPSDYYLENAVKIALMSLDLNQMQEGTHPGIIIITDMYRTTLAFLPRLGIMAVKKTQIFVQDALPQRLKGFHFINAPVFMSAIIALMKPFMNESFRSVLHTHSSPNDSLYECVPKEMFPKEISGVGATLEEMRRTAAELLLENRSFFLELEKMKVDESKRPGKSQKSKKIDEVKCYAGNLDID